MKSLGHVIAAVDDFCFGWQSKKDFLTSSIFVKNWCLDLEFLIQEILQHFFHHIAFGSRWCSFQVWGFCTLCGMGWGNNLDDLAVVYHGRTVVGMVSSSQVKTVKVYFRFVGISSGSFGHTATTNAPVHKLINTRRAPLDDSQPLLFRTSLHAQCA